jgi:NADH-quinone oxidoreductase subunit H
MMFFIFLSFKFLIFLISVLLSVAFFTLLERKVMASIQRRKGPNRLGIYGILQPLADGLKLFLKEFINPSSSNNFLFVIAPIWVFVLSLLTWAPVVFSFYNFLIFLNLGLLFIMASSSLSVYGIIIAGWASNSKYAFLGALRSAAQMISYEISLGLLLLCIGVFCESLNLNVIIFYQKDLWFVFPFFPIFIIFFITALAETNRPPFDLPEAEAELVSGFNIEYSSMGFALFFLGETASIFFMSIFMVILFFGGFSFFGILENFFFLSLIFSMKILFISFLFILIRATFPRYRYDQLMYLGWKVFLPLSLSFFLIIFLIIFILS